MGKLQNQVSRAVGVWAVEVKLPAVLTSLLMGQCCAAVTEISFVRVIIKGKGKVDSRRDHEGPDREKRYSCTLSLINLGGRSGWVVNATP
jgi:hypothetical protein